MKRKKMDLLRSPESLVTVWQLLQRKLPEELG